jgi:IS1 family transposase
VLELDELWSFVGKKADKRWVWIALARHTRQVLAYVIGDRGERTCRRLWEDSPKLQRWMLLQRFLGGVSGGNPRGVP